MIDSNRSRLRTAVFQNSAEKNAFAAVLQTHKTARDQGGILDLKILLSEIVGVFGHDTEEAGPTLATPTLVENHDQRGPAGAGGAS